MLITLVIQQVGSGLPAQVPLVQMSLMVVASASSQAVPSATATGTQVPLVASHMPVLHMSVIPEQSSAVPPQLPEVQTSVMVQASLSSHVVPSAIGIATHMPPAHDLASNEHSNLALRLPVTSARAHPT